MLVKIEISQLMLVLDVNGLVFTEHEALQHRGDLNLILSHHGVSLLNEGLVVWNGLVAQSEVRGRIIAERFSVFICQALKFMVLCQVMLIG